LNETIIKAARGLVGTPFHHQGRLPGVGLDCVGVVVLVARACGLEVVDPANYGRKPTLDLCLEYMIQNPVDQVDDAEIGDILLFSVDVSARRWLPPHFAIDLGETMVHCPGDLGGERGPRARVAEVTLDRRWLDRLHSRWRLRV
jgi:cell wall-associated NlpC family hydrolase